MRFYAYSVHRMNAKENREEEHVLELLDVVGQRSDVSQRHLARHLGVALGLANSYLKRCVRKGFIKITEAPANRYLYYLTPKGFSEKSRLTAKYLSTSFVWRTLKAAMPLDCCVLTDLQSPQLTYQQLVKDIARERVLVPEILRL